MVEAIGEKHQDWKKEFDTCVVTHWDADHYVGGLDWLKERKNGKPGFRKPMLCSSTDASDHEYGIQGEHVRSFSP